MSSFRALLREVQDVKYLKLGDVCRIVLCGSRSWFYQDSGFPVLKTSNIKNGQIVTYKLSYCDPKKHPTANVIKRGDVVITNVGKVAINLTDQEFFFISTIFRLVPRLEDVLIAKYLYYFLLEHSKEVDKLIWDGRLRKSDLKELVIPVPSLEAQERMVNVLDKNCPKVREMNVVKITHNHPHKEQETSKRKSFLNSLKSFFWQDV